MQIPIQNLYFLLCYAWNKLEEKEQVKVSLDETTHLADFFAKVLIQACKIILRRGIDKHYVDHIEEFAGVKGKIEFSQTLKSQLLYHQRTICAYDDFSANILTNRIIVSTLSRLAKTQSLNPDLKHELIHIQRLFGPIESIPLSLSLFKQIRIHRNNRFYGYIISLCEIIWENCWPTEEPGRFKFIDFTRDEKKMALLFEAFVRNFYKKEQKKFRIVKKEIIQWQLGASETNQKQYLPQMETDITLENDSQKIIIEAKYYRETMSLNFGKLKLKSPNLYQLFSYLLNQEDGSPKTQTATGILLYPTVENDYDLTYQFKGHSIQIHTLNLNSDWKKISERLLALV